MLTGTAISAIFCFKAPLILVCSMVFWEIASLDNDAVCVL